ncbi:hypothetical protein LEP1GSC058_3235 [Leptospira fainei serovar Hurstbridge str. BUT 6]|uniref:Uncharacterized protein n=1 Tax=Leptospira fainei serovar Hurstbridge str. BUT 6 TaxID=1193011 RepID=S3VYP4_9LEPT|nr:hypothetical protein [Leptospira fainei]EPG73242.1 hypothetical protein LEP1GSC058_3235 [Leptospira fainei serovar Hurstbridge str. BUT 6]
MIPYRKYAPWIVAGIVLLLLLIFIFWPDKAEKIKSVSQETESVLERRRNLTSGIEFPDAPHPFTEDPELEGQAKRLWPHAFGPKKTDADRERIREEWVEFAFKYPKNIYIPAEFRTPLTQDEERKAKERLDLVTAAESQFAISRNAGKFAEPGVSPSQVTDPQVTPQQQKAYFDYKIQELESRIQLVEYSIQQGKLDPSQIQEANQDISTWKNQLQQLRQTLDTVPSS